jgi:xanthine dehydrogenase accessory factor
MLVSREGLHGSVGGGNLEQTAIERAKTLLQTGVREPELLTVTLNPTSGNHGLQCCGGEVTLLLEPSFPHRPTVAIFGAGHVGWALVHVLSLLPISLYLIDSRASQLEADELPSNSQASLHLERAPVPETLIERLPAGTHLLVLTHDHAEDLAILDLALRRSDLGFIGLIGSKTKWDHFRRELAQNAHDDDALARVTTPIGLPGVPGKSPPAIAIATAAQLLGHLDLPDDQF